MSAAMTEMYLEQMGATIEIGHDDRTDAPGYVMIGNLQIRYWNDRMDIGWIPTFDRWANSTDWKALPPQSVDELRAILEEAERRGAAGEPERFEAEQRWIEVTP